MLNGYSTLNLAESTTIVTVIVIMLSSWMRGGGRCGLRKGVVTLFLFQGKQGRFAVETASVAGEVAVGTDHAVAGDDDRQWIMSHCAAYRLGGWHASVVVNGELLRQSTIGGGRADGDAPKQFPYFQTKRGSLNVERELEQFEGSVKIGVQLRCQLYEEWQGRSGLAFFGKIRQMLLTGKPEPAESFIIRQCDHLSEGGRDAVIAVHGASVDHHPELLCRETELFACFCLIMIQKNDKMQADSHSGERFICQLMSFLVVCDNDSET